MEIDGLVDALGGPNAQLSQEALDMVRGAGGRRRPARGISLPLAVPLQPWCQGHAAICCVISRPLLLAIQRQPASLCKHCCSSAACPPHAFPAAHACSDKACFKQLLTLISCAYCPC